MHNNMRSQNLEEAPPESHHSDAETSRSKRTDRVVPFTDESPNKRTVRKSARFNLPDSVEITIDLGRDDLVHGLRTALSEASGLTSELTARSSTASMMGRSTSARIREVSKGLEKLATFNKRNPTRRFDRTKSMAAHALKGLKFTSKKDGGDGWTAVEKRFDKLASATADGMLPRSLFCECIGMGKDSADFAGELFDTLARKWNIDGDSINKDQLKKFWEQINDQSFDTRLKTFFDMVDKDANGIITEDEITEIISLSASANKLTNIQKQAEEYAALIMEELDPDNLGYILIENLEMLLVKAAAGSHNTTTNNTTSKGENHKTLSHMLSMKLKTSDQNSRLSQWYEEAKYFLLDNWRRIWVVSLWVGAMAGLFAYKYEQYKHRAAHEVMGACVCMAKGAAETLKLNMALILLPVCRMSITWLRNKAKLGHVVPFDDNLNFHMLIAVAIAIATMIHTFAHVACDFPRLLHASDAKYKPMRPYFGDHQPSSYWHFVLSVEGLTGTVMLALMAVAFTLATPCFRRGRLKNLPEPLKKLTGFNAFWYSHHLFVVVYALLIVHGQFLYFMKEWYKKTTWMYLAVPLTIYCSERLIRAFRSSIKAVSILKVAVYPGNVLALHMSKPQGFKYKSGQYMFVNCAAVSPFEWHPFSITSSPKDDYLSVHIRTLGDWTQQLKVVFSKVCHPPCNGKSGLLRAECLQEGINPEFPRVLIDGPYGAPAQDYKKYEVVLLVGLGIGATPMISIVKDIVNNMKATDEEENGPTLTSANNSPMMSTPTPKTRRAYFYWVTREQGSFEWFKGVMNEVAELDHKGVIEMHNYCTSVYEEGDARSAFITMLQSINHAKNGVDVVSGTRVMSHFAKPDWRDVYKRIALNHTNSRVGVFYCGAPALTKELGQLALDFSHKTTTRFDFHKENF